MQKDSKIKLKEIKVDGGMSNNKSFLQSLSNITQIKIIKPKNVETTSLGAAFLAALQYGIITNTNDIKKLWKKDYISIPKIKKNQAKSNINKWKQVINTINKFY